MVVILSGLRDLAPEGLVTMPWLNKRKNELPAILDAHVIELKASMQQLGPFIATLSAAVGRTKASVSGASAVMSEVVPLLDQLGGNGDVAARSLAESMKMFMDRSTKLFALIGAVTTDFDSIEW